MVNLCEEPVHAWRHDPDELMKFAYRSLRDKENGTTEELAGWKADLLSGKSAGWAWFALRDLNLESHERTALCRTIARSEDGHLITWTLEENRNLSREDLDLLARALIKLNHSIWAIPALKTVSCFTDAQRRTLEKIAIGLDPD